MVSSISMLLNAKQSILVESHAHSYGDYYLNGVLLDTVDCYKGLGILFDRGLKFHQHASEACSYEHK